MIKIVLKSCQILKIVTLHVLYNAGLNNCYQSHGDITLEKNDRTAKKKILKLYILKKKKKKIILNKKKKKKKKKSGRRK
jgi:hypothetical protein